MEVSALIHAAHEDVGNAVMVIEHPNAGEDALIHSANGAFGTLLGRPEGLAGGRLGTLQGLFANSTDWAAFIQAIRASTPLKRTTKLLVSGRETWFGFALVFRPGPSGDYAFIIGRDITADHRRAAQESESQRLLAAVFLRISAPVMIVRENGAILMANPAFQRLMDFDPAEMARVTLTRLTPEEARPEQDAAAVRQLAGGGAYETRTDMLTRTGRRVPVRLSSVLLPDTQRLRLMTLLPELAPDPPDAAIPIPAHLQARSVGQVQVLSLEALRAASGEGWQRIATRALMMAEQVIKHRLQPGDIFSRSEQNGFIIWFENLDGDENAAVVAGAAREIKLRFFLEFGEDMASQVNAVVVSTDGPPPEERDETGRIAMSIGLRERLLEARAREVRDASALLAETRAAAAELRPVMGRDHRLIPLVMVDFAPAIRQRMAELSLSLPFDPRRGFEIDMTRLELALREIEGRPGRGSVLVALSWPTLSGADYRRILDERIAAIDPETRTRLTLVISGVPPLPSSKRWFEAVAPLRRQIARVGLAITFTDPRIAQVYDSAAEWPLSLLVADATEGGSLPPSGYARLIGLAQRRDIPILALPAYTRDIPAWWDLGIGMIAGEGVVTG
jgi:PAS domain S-box-containing protein